MKENRRTDSVLMGLERELSKILLWLRSNDYIINKVFLGEWSYNDPRYIKYLDERYEKRMQYDDIIKKIKDRTQIPEDTPVEVFEIIEGGQ